MKKSYNGPSCCPGCGKSGTESPRFTVKDVCHECEKLLRLGKAHEDSIRLENKRFNIVYINPFYARCNTKTSEKAYKAIQSMAATLNNPTGTETSERINLGHHSSYGRTESKIREDQAAEIKNLYNTIEECLKSAYLEGVNDGSNLLVSLNNGEITLDRFNERLK